MSDQSSQKDTDLFVTPSIPNKNENPLMSLKAGMEKFPDKNFSQCNSQCL